MPETQTFPSAFGKRLRELREARTPYTSQSKLAEMCGVTPGYISKLESGQRGNPQRDLAVRLLTRVGGTEDEAIALLDRPSARRLSSDGLEFLQTATEALQAGIEDYEQIVRRRTEASIRESIIQEVFDHLKDANFGGAIPELQRRMTKTGILKPSGDEVPHMDTKDLQSRPIDLGDIDNSEE